MFFFIFLLLYSHLFNHFSLQRPIPFHFHLLPIIKFEHLLLLSLPLFIPHSLLLSRRFLSNCPSLSLLFALFLFFYPPFFFLVICRGEAASAASSSIRRQIPTFCQRSARSHLQRSNKIKKPVTCTTGGKFPSPRGMSRPPLATGWKKKKKNVFSKVCGYAHLRSRRDSTTSRATKLSKKKIWSIFVKFDEGLFLFHSIEISSFLNKYP